MLLLINKDEYFKRVALIIEKLRLGNYSEETFERYFCCDDIIKQLENDDESFIYDPLINGYQYSDISLWISMCYVEFFLKIKKSFQFILIYFPYSDMVNFYEKYHQLSIDYLFEIFQEKINKESILRILIDRYGTTLNKLALLTNISYNTIEKYSRNNNFIETATIKNIYKIATFFSVDYKVFVDELDINIYPNENIISEFEILDRTLFFVLSYQEIDIGKRKFTYVAQNRMFKDANIVVYVRESYTEAAAIKVDNSKDNRIIMSTPLNNELSSKLKTQFSNVYEINNGNLKKVCSNKTIIKKYDNYHKLYSINQLK